MTDTHSPLVKLLAFLILLAIFGSIAAGILHTASDRSRENALEEYARCTGGCISTNVFISTPTGPHNPTDETCQKKCREQYLDNH